MDIDATLQTLTPTVMVPRHKPLPPLETDGHRFLAAMDGLWLEVRRPWLHAILPVAPQGRVAMPYGKVIPVLRLVPHFPSNLLEVFMEMANRSPDTEIAASLLWSPAAHTWRYQPCEILSSSGTHVEYLRPSEEPGEHLVVDLHSHGRMPAFFSRQDDEDDRFDAKIAVVVGDCGRPEGMSVQFRLCLLGMFLPLESPLGGARLETLAQTL